MVLLKSNDIDRSEYRAIVGTHGAYLINENGDVLSVKNFKRGLFYYPKKPTIAKNGYSYINLYYDGKVHKRQLHRLVCEAWLPNPHHYEHINHIDEDKQNNAVWNLEWCSAKYNKQYSNMMKRIRNAELTAHGLREKHIYLQIDVNTGELVATWTSKRAIARFFKKSYNFFIDTILKSDTQIYGGYEWHDVVFFEEIKTKK